MTTSSSPPPSPSQKSVSQQATSPGDGNNTIQIVGDGNIILPGGSRRTAWPLGAVIAVLAIALALAWFWMRFQAPKTETRISLVARDLQDQPLPGFSFVYAGIKSLPTTPAGTTELDLPPNHQTGQPIKVLLIKGPRKEEEWFLVNSQVNIPSHSYSAEVVLMRRSDFRQIASETRNTPLALRPWESPPEGRKQVVVAVAARHGLGPEQLESAIASFAETQNRRDQGIALFLEGEYRQAEQQWEKMKVTQNAGYVETLLYLGASQYQQAKYAAAASNFREAIVLSGETGYLLNQLGSSLYQLAAWTEAEKLLRQALAINEKSLGSEHPDVATDLNNLAQLLHITHRLPEAERLMRRALAIDEKRLGSKHPKVAADLNNLAQLQHATNRLPEAERLMRQALAITGADHPYITIHLNNMAQLLKATNRLSEAESLMRRALAIEEKNVGSEHPNVAIHGLS